MTSPCYILGTKVHPVNYRGAVAAIVGWAQAGETRYVCAANVHMVMEGYDCHPFRECVNGADLVTADGMPLVWALKKQGMRGATRVYGPDLTLHLLKAAEEAEIPVGFFGGRPEVLAALLENVRAGFPQLSIAYQGSPPFRTLSEVENAELCGRIESSGAKIVFVGLGCPKQERWMAANSRRFSGVMLGVGAAFDFLAKTTRQAPAWVQFAGLEWAFRLFQEPKRLWRRYLKHNPRFLVYGLRQSASLGPEKTR